MHIVFHLVNVSEPTLNLTNPRIRCMVRAHECHVFVLSFHSKKPEATRVFFFFFMCVIQKQDIFFTLKVLVCVNLQAIGTLTGFSPLCVYSSMFFGIIRAVYSHTRVSCPVWKIHSYVIALLHSSEFLLKILIKRC